MNRTVLLVEDSPGDVRLTKEAFRDADPEIDLRVVVDGVDAMTYLKREGVHVDAPRPDFTLLDLNLPKMDGREVLAHIKEDDDLRTIPTVILTTSDASSVSYRSNVALPRARALPRADRSQPLRPRQSAWLRAGRGHSAASRDSRSWRMRPRRRAWKQQAPVGPQVR